MTSESASNYSFDALKTDDSVLIHSSVFMYVALTALTPFLPKIERKRGPSGLKMFFFQFMRPNFMPKILVSLFFTRKAFISVVLSDFFPR